MVEFLFLIFCFYLFSQANVLLFHKKCTKPFHMHDVCLFPNQVFCLSATALAPLKFLHGGPRHTQIDVHKLGPSENLIDGSNTNTHYKITPPPPQKKKKTERLQTSAFLSWVIGNYRISHHFLQHTMLRFDYPKERLEKVNLQNFPSLYAEKTFLRLHCPKESLERSQ